MADQTFTDITPINQKFTDVSPIGVLKSPVKESLRGAGIEKGPPTLGQVMGSLTPGGRGTLSREDYARFIKHAAIEGGHEFSTQAPGVASGIAGLVTKSPQVAGEAGALAETAIENLQAVSPKYFGEPPKRYSEALERAGIQGAAGTLQEVGAKVLGSAGSHISAERIPESKTAKSIGIELHPGQEVRPGTAARVLGKFGEAGPSGQEFVRGQAGEMISRYRSLADTLGLPKDAVSAKVGPMYSYVDRVTAPRAYQPLPSNPKGLPSIPSLYAQQPIQYVNPAPVNIGPIKGRVLKMFENFDEVVNRKQLVPGGESSGAAQLINKIKNFPDQITFSEARELRSLALDLQRSQTEIFPGRMKAVATQVIDGLNAMMERSAKIYDRKIPKLDVWKTFREAQDAWKAGIERQNFTDFVEKATRPASRGEMPVDFVDAVNLDSRYRKLTPAEKNISVPSKIRIPFEQLISVGKQTGLPKSATGGLLSFARDAAFNALNTPAGRKLLTRGWSVPAGTPEAATLMTRIIGEYGLENSLPKKEHAQ